MRWSEYKAAVITRYGGMSHLWDPGQCHSDPSVYIVGGDHACSLPLVDM